MTNETTKLKKLGKNISKYRKLKGWSQNEFGDLLDVTREHIAKIETAKKHPSLKLLFNIASVLNVSEKDLFDFTQYE